MCGIVGLSLHADHPNARAVVGRMADTIVHRGPDSGGVASSETGHAYVGFRRLAIRDLNPRANQPMLSTSGRTLLVLNGEVYNSADLARRFLSNVSLRTSGDTEVVLEAIERHGLDIILPELNGMFAMGIVDVPSGRIALVRDRMGKKPLYVYQDKNFLAFGSELRALKLFGLRVDPSHAELFFHFGYFPSPHTFFERTMQVRPGEVVQVADGHVTSRRSFHCFANACWSTKNADLDELDALLSDSTQLRQLSDVPLGAFLSGGVDSTLVAAQLSKLSGPPTPTFTVAFADQSHDESADAADTARELSLPHQIIEIEEQNLTELAIAFQDCYEQPYADTSGLVTMLLCEAVKRHVTVAISADGGDEFFGGYARYSWFRKALSAQHFPDTLRQIAAMSISMIDQKRGHRLARWLTAPDSAALYAEILRNWHATDVNDVLVPDLNVAVSAGEFVRNVFDQTQGNALSKAACFDATYYIPDDLQVKLDRASMRFALEVRCPLLDFRVANLGIGLPVEAKYGKGLKTILKCVLRRHVSPQVLQRPKHGFSVPLARWLRGPLRELCADTFEQQNSREAGWLQTTTMQRIWEAFLKGQNQLAHHVWMLFSLHHHLDQPMVDPLFESLRDDNSFTTGKAA